jgi:phosphoribosyl 1,2-cyclic phosphate phosphodiesterase
LKITFLGTGTSQGIPIIGCECKVCQSTNQHDKRLRTSILVENENCKIVVDTGPDFREQMLKAKVKSIDAILYTHEHRDHIAGLDDIRAFNYLQNKPIDIYAEKNVIEALKLVYYYIFEQNPYPGVPKVITHQIDLEPFSINGFKIIPIRVMHYKLPIMCYRFNEFTYITDANYISEEEKEKIIGTKYLVVNALRKQKHISHFNLTEALQLIKELAPRKAWLIHISHQMGLAEEIKKELPENVSLAYDGLTIEI